MPRKALVLDANILIRAVLGHKVRGLIMDHAEQVDFFAPAVCFDDARKYLPELLVKRSVPVEPALAVLDAVARVVQPVEMDWLVAFEAQARLRLKRRDEDDWPVLAAALTLDCPIWTEDADFFGAGAHRRYRIRRRRGGTEAGIPPRQPSAQTALPLGRTDRR